MDENQDAPLQSDQNQEDPSDKLTPDHPRFKQVVEKLHQSEKTNEDLQQRLADLEERISKRQERTGDDEMDESEKAALDKIERQLKARGYVTQDVLTEKQRVERMAYDFDRYSNKYDGANGYPKFVAADVAAHMKKKGIDDMEEAYFSLHRPAIIEVEAKKLAGKPIVPTSEKPSGGTREQPVTEVTPEQIAQMSDQDYEKYRENLLAGFKKNLK